MSSIYKKGRDGYYYYQTYVFNPKTRKKDKRIFHALGTKNPQEAKEFQKGLDLKYDKLKNNDQNLLPVKNLLNKKLKIIILMGLMLVTYLVLLNLYKSEKVIEDDFLNNKILQTSIPDTETMSFPVTFDEKIETFQNHKDTIQFSSSNTILKNFPNYNIERRETISNVFQQGKLYVTIDINTSMEDQLLLCDSLLQLHDNYKNIIICLYANSIIGKKLAMGIQENISIMEQKEAWLAMYTYNEVEGKYFDNNPSGYLGISKD